LGEEPVPILHALLPPIDWDPVRAAGLENLENPNKGRVLDRLWYPSFLGNAPTSVTLKTFKTGF
jgi:hypothetical protein